MKAPIVPITVLVKALVNAPMIVLQPISACGEINT